MKIRPEQISDEHAIHDLTVRAFKPMSFSQGTEAPIISNLREDGDLTISLVALNYNQIVGHIAFSPVTIDGKSDGWYGLGPVSVEPNFQRRGIGTMLINEGLSILKAGDAVGCTLIGNPDYYERFGFLSDGQLTYGDVSPSYVQWLSFGDATASGSLRFSPAFER